MGIIREEQFDHNAISLMQMKGISARKLSDRLMSL